MRNAVSGPDLEVMLPFLGVPPERIDWYLQLSEIAKEKGWWDSNRAIPDWFSLYIGLEWGASVVHEWDLGYVPGILQTRAYADAVIRDESRASDLLLRKQADARRQRREALDREKNPIQLHAVMDEAVLRRDVGSVHVMQEQLAYLIEMAQHPRVCLQILPFGAGPNRGQLGSFTWLGFPREDDPGVVYLESQRGSVYLEESADIATFHEVFAELEVKALRPEESIALLVELGRGG